MPTPPANRPPASALLANGPFALNRSAAAPARPPAARPPASPLVTAVAGRAQPPSSLTAQLTALGYPAIVAERLAAKNPELAAKIAREKTPPVMVYRGLGVEPSRFNPAQRPSAAHYPYTFFTRNRQTAVAYAEKQPQSGTLVELALPSSMLLPSKGRARYPRSDNYLVVDFNALADLGPFVVSAKQVPSRRTDLLETD